MKGLRLLTKSVLLFNILSALSVIIFLFAARELNAAEESSDITAAERYKNIFSYIPKIKGADEKLWQFKIGGWYQKKTGNTDNLDSNFNTNYEYDDETLEAEFDFQNFYKKDDGKVKEKNWKGELRFGYYLLQRLEITAFTISEYDKKAFLDHRNFTGAGPKIIFFKNYFWKLDLTGAPTRLYEKYDDFESDTDLNWTTRFQASITPVKIVKLTYAFFHSVNTYNKSDYNYRHDASFGVTIEKYLELSSGYVYKFNSKPPPVGLVKKTDDFLYFSVSLQL